jgi:REP element-mobilizing transposase RayT
MNSQPKIFYRRHLPHYHPPHATYHVVFRLDGSLPAHVIERLKAERAALERKTAGLDNPKQKREKWQENQKTYFGKFDAILDGAKSGPRWLARPDVAQIVAHATRHRDGNMLDVDAYCIMPNHVHLVGRVADPSYNLADILASLKKYTARQANELLHRSGTFWQSESYDHVIRNGEELLHTVHYVLNNPVKAGLCDLWQNWPWSYCREGIL